MPIPTILASHPDPAASRAQQRDVRCGRLVRIGHGAFVLRREWEAATEWEQHIARATVAHRSAPRTIVSHASAVIVHRLPWISPVPERVTLLDPARLTGQRQRFADRIGCAHRSPQTVRVDGLPVTAHADTAIDVALRYDRARALAVADAVVRRGTGRETLVDLLAARCGVRAHRRSAFVLDLASGLSESAGESVAHLVMRDVGCPAPVQQHEFRDSSGLIGRVDFWFPEHGVIIEFDGLAKYRDPTMRAGRSADEVVVAEKLREDRLRALPGTRRLIRPVWRDIVPGGRFPAMLAAAGLPVRRGLVATPAW